MQISRGFIKLFLILLVVVLVTNIISFSFGFWTGWMGWSLGFLLTVLFFLTFRKYEIKFVRLAAFALPILFVLFFLSSIFIAANHSKDYTISVVRDGSVFASSNKIWFENASGQKITNVSDIYSLGYINLVFRSGLFQRNAKVNISVNGNNVSLAKLDFDIENSKMDYFWNFSKEVPSIFKGSAVHNKDFGCTYFNSSKNQTLSYPKSSEMFEKDSFVVYVKWKPEKANNSAQQIIGHYNWELLQNNDSVEFAFEKLTDKKIIFSNMTYQLDQRIIFSNITYKIDKNFFNKTHELVALYLLDRKNSGGYLEFYVDGNFVGRESIANGTLFTDDDQKFDLTLGKSQLNGTNYFSGCVYSVGFDYGKLGYYSNDSLNLKGRTTKIPIIGLGDLSSVKISIS